MADEQTKDEIPEVSDVPVNEGHVNEEEIIEDAEIDEFENRTLKDIILGNQLPPHLLFAAIGSFLVFFELFLAIAGFFIDKYYTPVFSIPFLIIPALWGWAFYWRSSSFRSSASLQRTLQSLMLGYFSDTLVYLVQWIIMLLITYLIIYIYELFGKEQLILVISAAWETLFSSIFLEAIPEELLKWAILYHIATLEPLPSRYGTCVYAIYASLGFIFFSGSLRIVRVYWMSDFERAAVYFAVEATLTSTMHIIAGLWIGLNFVKQRFRDPLKQPFPSYRVFTPSIILHAVYMSFISLLYLLYELEYLNWKLFALICILAFCFLFIALVLTMARVRKLFSDPSFYALLTNDDEPNTADVDMEELGIDEI
mmetsp:Transcript_24195/g.41326  ORF Transcript_24195/g.41326 Transcript_24195/m.41326 type:complete len:368 (-) Transcript_24195:39-1142(-)